MRSKSVLFLVLSGAVLLSGLLYREASRRGAGAPDAGSGPADVVAARPAEAAPAGMSGGGPGTAAPPAAVLGTDSAASLEALADTVRARALRGDTLGLLRLLIDDTLFRRHVWPASPAYDSSRESVFQFVRGMDKANNAKGLRRMLHDVRTLGPEKVPGAFAYEAAPAAGGALHLLKPAKGVRLFGGALEVNGAYRVLNYSESGASQTALASE